MNESNPINYNDLFSSGAWEKAIENLNKYSQSLTIVEGGLTKVAQLNGKIISSTGKKISLDDYKKENDAIEKINATYEAKIKLMQEQLDIDKKLIDYKSQKAKADKAEADAIKKTADETKKANAQTREQIQYSKQRANLAKAEVGSLNELKARLSLVTTQYNKMSEARRNSALGKAFLSEQKQLTDSLNKFEQAGGNFHRQVGNYHLALGKLGKGIKGITGILGELGLAFGINTEAMERFIGIGSEINKTLKELHHAENLKKVASQEHTAAVIEETGVEELHNEAMAQGVVESEAQTVSTTENAVAGEANVVSLEAQTAAQEELALAQSATPWGAIIVGVLALGAALYGLNYYLTSSSKETKALEKENKALNAQHELGKEIIEARIKFEESNLELLKAQGVSLKVIREEEEKLYDLKDKQIKQSLLVIDSNINVDKSKLADIQMNNSLSESLVELGYATGLYTKEQRDKMLQDQKGLRGKEIQEDLNKQYAAGLDQFALLKKLEADKLNEEKKATEKSKDLADDRIKKLQDEAKANQDLLDAEADRIAGIMTEQNRLNEELGTANEQLISKLKDQRDADALERQKELNEGLITQEQYNDYILGLDQKLADGINDIYDKQSQDELSLMQAEADAQIKLWEDEEDALQKLSDARRKKYEDELTQIASLNDAVEKGLEGRSKAELDALKTQSAQIDSELSVQQQLFADGLDSTLAYEQRAKAENTQKELAAQRKAAKEKKGIELANTYISFLQSYLKDGTDAQGAATKALAQTLIAEGIADAIAGTALEGVEDTGGAGSMDKDGGKLWVLHPHERVIPKDINEKLGDVSNDELGQMFDSNFANIYSPNMNMQIASDHKGGNGNVDMQTLMALNGKLIQDGIEKGFAKIKIENWTLDARGRLVQTELQNGMQKTIIHQDNIFRS